MGDSSIIKNNRGGIYCFWIFFYICQDLSQSIMEECIITCDKISISIGLLGFMATLFFGWSSINFEKMKKAHYKKIFFINQTHKYLNTLNDANLAYREAITVFEKQKIKNTLSIVLTMLVAIDEIIPNNYVKQKNHCREMMENVEKNGKAEYYKGKRNSLAMGKVSQVDLFYTCNDIDSFIFRMRKFLDNESFYPFN